MVELATLGVVYLFALGCGVAVIAATYIDSRDDDPARRRRRLGFAVACAVVGLFPLPLLLGR